MWQCCLALKYLYVRSQDESSISFVRHFGMAYRIMTVAKISAIGK